MPQKIDVGVLGATGMVGQQFIRQLQGHPWFQLTWLGASARSTGKNYVEAAHWHMDGPIPESVANMQLQEAMPDKNAPMLMFSAMDASVAGDIEQAFAKAGRIVVSNSRNHRMLSDVPLLVPEINSSHIGVLEQQRKNHGWDGAIVTNPNCSTIALCMGLAPLVPFVIRMVQVSTMQALSGAGIPGVPSMDSTANVIPYIPGEEEKVESETIKILGVLRDGQIDPMQAVISAQCNRVPVIDGHLVAISVELQDDPGIETLRNAFCSFRGVPQEKALPTAPERPIELLAAEDRPQPRKDSLRGNGMTVSIGRLRECPVLSYKFLSLGHNTIRGAAGAAVLNAELLHSEGLLTT